MSNQAENIIDGKAIAETIRGEIKEEVTALVSSTNITPGLAVVLVGNRTDSATYVRMKIKACEEVGIQSFKTEFGADVTEEELIAKVVELNNNPAVHGILVQLPLPGHIHEQKVLDTILPDKDVDGLHPLNLAKLAHTNTHGSKVKFDLKTLPYHAACTPQGCIELIERSGISIEGKEAVVIGRSNIVGIPVSLLLLQKNATVTIVHSRTKDAAAVVKRADIVVAAVGRAEMVKGDWIKPGATVIDVGINSVDDPSSKKGYKLVGDVDFASAKEVAGKITPVPGGVGPMTIAMLLRNTLQGARRSGEGKTEEAAGKPSEYTL
jgi:5,10-methylene-tetrahydrofolate dehydrogenase/methenyl tetrahydrofolate cyclohydrolase